jgi:two-component system LytT family sensor kinase
MPALLLSLQANTQYDLLLRYNFQTNNIDHYIISVKPHWWQTFLLKFIAGVVIALFLFFIPFYIYRKNKQQQLLKTEFEKNQKKLELKAVYAQLNPHFIFNALSSIQSLINQNKVEQANHYLTEFSSLLRQSLCNHEKEMLPLNKELNVLGNYLDLEQLRFDFKYTISVDPAISITSTEIPPLLLQPLIENAIKHGITHLKNNGHVSVDFSLKEKNVIITITDNGKGFDKGITHTGYGLRLTEERIALINQSLKDQTISFTINSNIEGTVIHLMFKNWIQ